MTFSFGVGRPNSNKTDGDPYGCDDVCFMCYGDWVCPLFKYVEFCICVSLCPSGNFNTLLCTVTTLLQFSLHVLTCRS